MFSSWRCAGVSRFTWSGARVGGGEVLVNERVGDQQDVAEWADAAELL